MIAVKNAYPLTFMLLLLLAASAKADIQQQTLHYLNKVRDTAGMVAFQPNAQLQRAASGHARYLIKNQQWDHHQRPGSPGFTGVKPLQRILAAGYNNRHISENISSHQGSGSPLKSIDGLMSAIYHRFAFLSFDHDEIGIGYAEDSKNQAYVYNMGNSSKRDFCAYPEKLKPVSEYIYLICAIEDTQLNSSIYDETIKRDRKRNPGFVVWPGDKSTGIPPAFYEESPDPLPNIDVSGYPVSIQFNPGYYPQAPRIKRFELFRMPDREPVRLAASFDEQRDPHQKITAHEFAIFPLYRLNWNTVYQAEVDMVNHTGHQQTVSWQFRTHAFPGQLHHVLGGETIRAEQSLVYVYAPPASHQDGAAELLLSYRGFVDVQVEMFDAHTLMINASGNSGQAVFNFHGRQFRLVR